MVGLVSCIATCNHCHTISTVLLLIHTSTCIIRSLSFNYLYSSANTVVTCSTNPNDVKCFNQPALEIFTELCRGELLATHYIVNSY